MASPTLPGEPGQGGARAPPVHVLVVDDEALIVLAMRADLERHGYRVTMAFDGARALAAFDKDPADAVVTDFRMPGMTGLELIGLLRQRRHPGCPPWS